MNTPKSTVLQGRHPTQMLISSTNIIGGGIGILVIASLISTMTFEIQIVLTWLFLLVQNVLALYGGWRFWNNSISGVRILYWVSLSSIPVIFYSGFSYTSTIGPTLLATLTLGQVIDNQYIFANINFDLGITYHIGRDLATVDNTTIVGVNLVALSFVLILGRAMKVAGVSLFPVARLNAYVSLLSTSVLLSYASIYKCVNSNGQVFFQEKMCPLMSDESSAIKSAPRLFRAHILITESNADIEHWIKTPSNILKPDSARLRFVRRGQQLIIPAVVTDYTYDAPGKIGLSADFLLVSPSGKTLLDAKKFSGSNNQDTRTPGLIVLNPVLNLTLDSTDPVGLYTVHITVWDGARSVLAEESFELVE